MAPRDGEEGSSPLCPVPSTGAEEAEEALQRALGTRSQQEVVRCWRGKVRVASCDCCRSMDTDHESNESAADEEVALQAFCRLLTSHNYQHLELHDFNVGLRVYQKLRLFHCVDHVGRGPVVKSPTARYLHHIYEYAGRLYGRMVSATTSLLISRDQASEECKRSVVVHRQARNAVFHPHFAVFVEPPRAATVGGHDVSGRLLNGRVVVAIRGTMSLADALTDVAAEPVRMEVGSEVADVHQGMLLSASNLLASVREPVLQALADHPDYDLVVTGHSLGGGSAILLTLLMRASPDALLRRATCVAFGPPPVLRGAVQDQCEDFIESVVNEDDIVPRLSIPSVLCLLQVADYAHSLSWWRQLLLATRLDCFVDVGNVHVTAPGPADEQRRLFIPGKVYRIMTPFPMCCMLYCAVL
eukprot:GGOE01004795.1.p1 GENE.GGOE01004795.1~~GGOE01004795.1.p1  ORF type:complete len:422 (+),score=104.88 GGOE01004795.1:25-1266(+)